MFSCPNCKRVVGEYPETGVLVVVCAHCTFKYELSAGAVKSMSSRRVEVSAATAREDATYARRFELTIQASPRETLRFTFDTDRADEWIRIPPGNVVDVVFSMRVESREELLYIVDRTSCERFVLARAGTRSRQRALLYGSGLAVLAGIGAVALAVPAIGVIGVVLATGFAASKGFAFALKPRHGIGAGELETLNVQQGLLGQKRTLLQSRSEVVAEIETRRALKQRLGDLRARMVSVALDAYAPRIETIARALASLDAQLAVDEQLLAEYDRTIQIIDIEYDSMAAADAMPSDGGGAILESRLAELRGVEDLRAETTRRLAANAEVEQLLRTHSG